MLTRTRRRSFDDLTTGRVVLRGSLTFELSRTQADDTVLQFFFSYPMKHEFSTVKKLGFVFDLLRVHNIHSAAEFRTLIGGMDSLDLGVQSTDGPVS